MRWFIGSATTAEDALPALPADHPPVPSSSSTSSSRPPAQCPMHNSANPPSLPVKPKSSMGGAKCPVQHDKASDLNPYTSMPKDLATTKQPGQVLDLPTERTSSSIPRPQGAVGQDDGDVWDYPSPQQFYNALVRKGWETPEESIEMVVDIHNFLNERAWDEVMQWERRVPGGESAQLARFQGRPGELSPKARLHLFLGKIFPSKFNTVPPFDRHDWVVTRPANGGEQVRYVIDYYSAPDDDEGNPVFVLDVRPALDSLESINQRIKVGFEEWMKSGQETAGAPA